MPGTKRKRGKKYYLEVVITDYSGKVNRYSKTCDLEINTDKKAEKELSKFYAECAAGNVTKQSSITVSEMCDLVMNKLATPTLKRGTIRGYKVCKQRIDKTIGNKKAAKLKPLHVQDWVNDLKNYNKGLSPKTIKNTFSFLRMCYETMIDWGELSKDPCERIRLPEIPDKDPDSLTIDEVEKFLTVLDGVEEDEQDYKVAALIALFCGLRRGEICGIDEDLIDLDSMEGKVKKALYIDNDGVYEDTPKSKRSYRSFVFPAEVGAEIQKLITYHKKQKLLLGRDWHESTTLIKGAFGDSMYPSNLWYWLSGILDANGMRHFSFHALRHTYASMLSWIGKDIVEVSESLGHSQKSTTLNIYSHLFENLTDAKKRTASELSKVIINKAE